ncbi:glucosyltransferase domain-containing protein [Eggerthella timonensis]|uniref:glucosyltransferase domain-containing protein n=1 Tax=Eggerthella timonensis TaxID=1871008 RepID=UPI000C76491E|nr:glucosyltransferase domain-containing protein [Eggerthella timonensis]
MSVDDVISAIRKRVTTQMLVAFSTALVLGFATHLNAMTGMLMNWDSATIKFGSGFALTQGKWFYSVLDYVHGIINVGSITIPLAIAFCALSAALLVDVLGIKRSVHAGLVGAALITFPSVMVICAYNSEDIFLFAVLLSILSVYVLLKFKYGFAIGIVLLTLSLGIYQAYIGFAAAALLLVCIKDLLFGRDDSRTILLRALKYVLFLIVAVVVYYVVLQIVIGVSGASLSEYRGISDTLSGGALSLSTLVSSIGSAYAQFFSSVWFDFLGTGDMRFVLVYRVATVAVVLLIIALAISSRIYRKPMSLCLLVLFVALFPLAANIVVVLSFGASQYFIMAYPLAMCPVFLILLVDMVLEKRAQDKLASISGSHSRTSRQTSNRFGVCAQWAVVLIALCMVFNWYVLDNQGYTRMKVSYDQAYSISSGMIEDITSTEGYDSSSQVAIMGLGIGKRTDPGYVKTDIFVGLDPILGIPSRMFAFRTDYYWNSFVSNYMGYTFNLADGATKDRIELTDEYRNMPVFPADGSTKVIEGVITVKLA